MRLWEQLRKQRKGKGAKIELNLSFLRVGTWFLEVKCTSDFGLELALGYGGTSIL